MDQSINKEDRIFGGLKMKEDTNLKDYVCAMKMRLVFKLKVTQREKHSCILFKMG